MEKRHTHRKHNKQALGKMNFTGLSLLFLAALLNLLFFAASIQAGPSVPVLIGCSKQIPGRINLQKIREMTQFSEPMVTEEKTEPAKTRSIQQIMDELAEVEKQYVDLLNEGNSATGLYATGEYDTDYRNGEDKYYGQLELRLFNDGYLEELRRQDKKILQTKLELLQVNRDMDDRALADEMYTLYTMENAIHAWHSLARIQALKKILPERKESGRNGFTTKIDILEISRALALAQREYDFYTGREQHKLSPELAAVLNTIESVQLKDCLTLGELSKSNSSTLEIQDVFIKRARHFPAWSDNLSIDLFAGCRKEFSDFERNYVGIKLEIPLYWNNRKNHLINLQQRIYRFQKEAAARRIDQNLDKLSAYFIFYQQKIQSGIGTLSLLTARKQAAQEEMDNPIQRDSDDPRRLLHTLKLKIIDASFEALDYRLKEYELILKIMALTGIQDIRELFLPAQPGSPDHSVAPRQHHQGPE